MDDKDNFSIHVATVNDIPTLVKHHHKMFKEIWTRRELEIHTHRFEEMDKAYTRKLNKELAKGKCIAWVIRKENKIVASGAISINSMVPRPEDSSYKDAFLHSVFTEHGYRNKGFATMITEKAIQYCRSKGIRRMSLGASDAGRPIYEKIGFKPSDRSMELSIKKQLYT